MLPENWGYMDIAKIRKKAQQKSEEKKTAEPVEAPSAAEKKEKQQDVPEKQPAPVREEKAAGPAVPLAEKPAEAMPSAKPPAPAAMKPVEDQDAVVELLTFSLAKEEFAVRVAEVEEIIKYQRITKVPTLPEYITGITSLRGKIIPVTDLKTRLNLKDKKHAEEPSGGGRMTDHVIAEKDEKILIISGPEGFIGAIIDKVIGVVRLHSDKILQPPAHLSEAEMKFIEGVVILEKRFISIIRADDAMKIELQ